MWLHRENEYEWKYIGVWLDMLPEQVLSKVVNQNTDLFPESTLVLFKKYINTLDMIQTNLSFRNLISVIKNNNDLEKEEKKTKIKIEMIENMGTVFMRGLSLNCSELSLYINEKNEFKIISLI